MIGIDLTLLLDGENDVNGDDSDDKCEDYDDVDSTLTANCSLNCLINFPSSVRISWVFKRWQKGKIETNIFCLKLC